MTRKNELRREESCSATYGAEGAEVSLESCPVGQPLPDKMKWSYDKTSGHITHLMSGKCLDADNLKAGGFVKVTTCEDNKDTQKWEIEFMLDE